MTRDEEVEAFMAGEGCLGKSQGDEPVFVLVARDRVASIVVRTWATLAGWLGAPKAKTDEAMALADRMDAWRDAHGGGKVPD